MRAGSSEKACPPTLDARAIGANPCGETPKPRMAGGEVPIKHGSADGGLARERRERLAAGGRSARAARGILARMTHAEPSSRANRIASPKFSPPRFLLDLARVAARASFCVSNCSRTKTRLASRWSLGQHLI